MPTREQSLYGNPGKRGNHGGLGGKALSRDMIAAAEKRRKAVEARARGMDWNRVAVAAGYDTREKAMAAVRREMAELRQANLTDVEQLRDMEVGRLDQALLEITLIAYDRDLVPERRLVALEAMRRNIETRSKLLNLYPATTVEVVTVGQIERRVAELSHRLGMPLPPELLELPAGDSDDYDS